MSIARPQAVQRRSREYRAKNDKPTLTMPTAETEEINNEFKISQITF
jgi:hypothetical protein